MADDRIEISIELDDGSVQRGFVRVEEQARRSANNISGFFIRAAEFASGQAIYEALSKSFNLITDTLSSAIEEAAAGEQAINRLNTSLRLAGTYSEAASQSFQDMAAEIQRTTTYADDQVLGIAALARNYASTNEEAIKLTKASIDFAEATGIDAESAVRRLGGTLSGELGAGLTKINPELRTFTKQQLEAGAAVDSFASRFAGAASQNALSFSGQITRLKNTFSDLLEEIGKIVTESPAVGRVISVIAERIESLTSSITAAAPQLQETLTNLLSYFIQFSAAMNALVIAPIEVVFNTAQVALNGIMLIVQGFVLAIANAASELVSFFAPDSELAKSLAVFSESTGSVFDDMSKKAGESVDNVFSTDNANKIADFLGEVDGALNTTQATVETVSTSMDNVGDKLLTFGESVSIMGSGFKAAMDDMATNARKNLAEIGANAFRFLGGAVGNAFAAFGKAIAKGQNALSAFLNSLIASFGQMAIQLGSQFILQGIAYTWAGLPNGPALIAAGAALATFGGVLSAVGGGGGESGVGVTGGSAGGYSPTSPIEAPADAVSAQSQQRVTVNIQGDVLDSQSSGLRIIELLNEAFNSQGARVLTT